MELDETDLRILEHLQQNGRASLRSIAEEQDLSPSTVSNRFHRLQEEGVLQGMQPVIDYEKIGVSLTAVVELSVETQEIETVADTLRDNDRVPFFYEVTGDTDMILICKFRDREDMNAFVKQLQKQHGIQQTETKVVLTDPKEHAALDLRSVLKK